MIDEYKFGPWLPDQTDYKNPGLEVCRNAIPSPGGYKPAVSLVATAATVTGTIIGAKGFEKSDGTPVVVCATTSDLYVVVGGTANASSLSLSLSATDAVAFEQFSTKIYASTKDGDTWVLDSIESDTTFAAASGSPPNANAIGRVGDFLVMGDLTDIDASNTPYRIRWSQFNNPDGTWGTDIATQSGATDLDAKQGRVMAISGGTFGMVFQRFGISRMTYTGGSSVFRLDIFEKNRGCAAPESVVRVGDVAYFLSFDGFFKTDGTSATPISRARVWEWFLDNANQTYLAEVVGAIDWEARCCVWSFAGGDDRAHTIILWFNWETGEWGYSEHDVDYLVATAKAGLTLEQVAAIYPDLDTMSISLDSPAFKAAGRTLGAFTGNALATFTGATLEAEFVSGSLQPITGKRTYVSSVTPLIANDDEDAIVYLGTRDTMTKAYTVSSGVTIGSLGFAPFNADARYFRVGITIPSGSEWSDAYGYQLDAKQSGAT